MRERPWLDPRVWPGSNCSWTTTSAPRCRSLQPVASPITPAPITATRAMAGTVLAWSRYELRFPLALAFGVTTLGNERQIGVRHRFRQGKIAPKVQHAPTRGRSARAWADAVPQHPDPLDLELDHVARPEPAAVAELEDAARPDRTRAE